MIVNGRAYQNDETGQKDRNRDTGRKEKSHIQCWKYERFEHYADKCPVDTNKDDESFGESSQSSSRGNRDGSFRRGPSERAGSGNLWRLESRYTKILRVVGV